MFGSDRFAFETPNVIDPGDLPPSQPPRRTSTNQSSGSNDGSHGSGTASTHDDTGSSSDEDNNHHSPGGAPGSSKSSEHRSILAGSGRKHSNKRTPSYENVRGSTVRLLRDIGDLDLSPSETDIAAARGPYDPYHGCDDDDEDDEENGIRGGSGRNYSHSLPSVEEARLYATRLLVHSNSPKNRGSDKYIDGSTESLMKDGEPKRLNPPSPFTRSPFGRTIQLDAPSSSHHLVRRRVIRIACRVAIFLIIVGIAVGVGFAVGNKHSSSADTATTKTLTDGTSTNTSTSKATTANNKQNTKRGSAGRQDAVTAFLIENGISSDGDLHTEGTPQELAAQWLSIFDPLQLDIPEKVHSGMGSKFVQRYVLAVLFYALKGKDSWKKDYNFLSATDECSWYEEAIIPDHVQEETALGVSCDMQLQVKNIYMPSNGLQGSIPSEISRLSSLDMFAIPSNQVTGRLPSEMQQLTTLVYFDIKYNQISGYLPDWIGDCDQLEVLGLSNNQFAGAVPASYGTLNRLKTMAIDDNALTGSLEFLNHLTNLEYFWADRNLLTGVVDDSFVSRLTSLQQLDLSFNNLRTSSDGVFPIHLLQHKTLRVLDLSDTSLEQVTLPEIGTNNNVLEFLSLRRVGLQGPIPDSIKYMQALTHLDLFGNELTGLIPNGMGEMLNLNYLSLGSNKFTSDQEFPPFLSQLIQLRELSLASLQLSGPIPSWIRYLNKLKLLDLSENGFAGSIPAAVWNLPELSYLLLNDNQLTGTVPQQVDGGDKLQIVSLYHNKLSSGNASKSVDHFCTANPDIDLLAVDCTATCSKDCCREGCCAKDDDDCFQGKVATYLTWYEGMWEFNYTRPSYSYDPAILAEAQIAKVLVEEEDGYDYDNGALNWPAGDAGDYVYSNQRGDYDP